MFARAAYTYSNEVRPSEIGAFAQAGGCACVCGGNKLWVASHRPQLTAVAAIGRVELDEHILAAVEDEARERGTWSIGVNAMRGAEILADQVLARNPL